MSLHMIAALALGACLAWGLWLQTDGVVKQRKSGALAFLLKFAALCGVLGVVYRYPDDKLATFLAFGGSVLVSLCFAALARAYRLR